MVMSMNLASPLWRKVISGLRRSWSDCHVRSRYTSASGWAFFNSFPIFLTIRLCRQDMAFLLVGHSWRTCRSVSAIRWHCRHWTLSGVVFPLCMFNFIGRVPDVILIASHWIPIVDRALPFVSITSSSKYHVTKSVFSARAGVFSHFNVLFHIWMLGSITDERVCVQISSLRDNLLNALHLADIITSVTQGRSPPLGWYTQALGVHSGRWRPRFQAFLTSLLIFLSWQVPHLDSLRVWVRRGTSECFIALDFWSGFRGALGTDGYLPPPPLELHVASPLSGQKGVFHFNCSSILTLDKAVTTSEYSLNPFFFKSICTSQSS